MGVSWEDNPRTEKLFEDLHDLIRPINRCWDNLFPRKISVKIIDDDVWNADHTLALVILPVLQKIKETNNGFCQVDKDDLPDGFDLEDGEAAWNELLDQMIWSFEEILEPTDDQFFHNMDNQRYEFEPIEGSNCSRMKSVVINESKPAPHFDKEGYRAHQERIQHGLTLFGKYYRGLWT